MSCPLPPAHPPAQARRTYAYPLRPGQRCAVFKGALRGVVDVGDERIADVCKATAASLSCSSHHPGDSCRVCMPACGTDERPEDDDEYGAGPYVRAGRVMVEALALVGCRNVDTTALPDDLLLEAAGGMSTASLVALLGHIGRYCSSTTPMVLFGELKVLERLGRCLGGPDFAWPGGDDSTSSVVLAKGAGTGLAAHAGRWRVVCSATAHADEQLLAY